MSGKYIDAALNHCFSLNLNVAEINLVRKRLAESKIKYDNNQNLFSRFCAHLNARGVTKLNDFNHLMQFMILFNNFVCLENGIESVKKIEKFDPGRVIMDCYAITNSGREIKLPSPPMTNEYEPIYPGAEHTDFSVNSPIPATMSGSIDFYPAGLMHHFPGPEATEYDVLGGVNDADEGDEDNSHGQHRQDRQQRHYSDDGEPASSANPVYTPSSEHTEYPVLTSHIDRDPAAASEADRDPTPASETDRDPVVDSGTERDPVLAFETDRDSVMASGAQREIKDWRRNQGRRQSLQSRVLNVQQPVSREVEVIEEQIGSFEDRGLARRRRHSLESGQQDSTQRINLTSMWLAREKMSQCDE